MLVLQNGPNASVDYFLRRRLEVDPDRPWAVANLADRPEGTPFLAQPDLLVIFCRYTSRAWLDAIRRRRGSNDDVWAVHFADDDLDLMITDRSLPLAIRARIAQAYGRHRHELSKTIFARWVGAPALAHRPEDRVLTPVAFEPSPAPSENAPSSVLYHGTDVHGAERCFVAEIARRLRHRSDIRFEIAGRSTARSGEDGIEWIEQVDWPTYHARQTNRRAALFLAPLFDNRINAGRAPVKRFDAARVGAAGLYASTAPYIGCVRDGVDGLLLPMEVNAWCEAITSLIDNPNQRLEYARQARHRIEAERISPTPLPWPLSPDRAG